MVKQGAGRLVPIVFFLASTAVLGLLSFCAVRLFEGAINPEGTMALWEIMIYQGAPLSHYEAEHPRALGLYRAVSAPGGAAIGSIILVGFTAAWCFLRGSSLLRWRLLVDALFSEAALCSLNVLVSASLAFHHVGHGLPCNYQWWGTLFMMNYILALPTGAVILLGRRLLDLLEPQSPLPIVPA